MHKIIVCMGSSFYPRGNESSPCREVGKIRATILQ